MTALKLPHCRVLAELADGLPQHVSHLARIAGVKPHQLNGFWQQMPAHIRGLLRQHDGQWRLVRPLALFDEEALQRLGAERGFQTTSPDALPEARRRDYLANGRNSQVFVRELA